LGRCATSGGVVRECSVGLGDADGSEFAPLVTFLEKGVESELE
jgi:hypothetical protein